MPEVKSIITIVAEREAVTEAGMREPRMTEATWAHHPAVPGGRAPRRSDAEGHDRGGQDCYFAHHDACSVGCVKRPGRLSLMANKTIKLLMRQFMTQMSVFRLPFCDKMA